MSDSTSAAIPPLFRGVRCMRNPIIVASNGEAIAEMVKDSIKRVDRSQEIVLARDEYELQSHIQHLNPKLILLEVNFCYLATAYLMAQNIKADRKLRFVIFNFEPVLKRDLGVFYNLGAIGFLDFRKSEYLRGIGELLKGNEYISDEIAACLGDCRVGVLEQASFSIREIQVLRFTARGKSPEYIGLELNISPRSVKNIRSRIYEKTGIKNGVQLLLFALNLGYVTVDELGGRKEKSAERREELAVKELGGRKGEEMRSEQLGMMGEWEVVW
jgi:DNA-binding NarL/FixJ family response regulator